MGFIFHCVQLSGSYTVGTPTILQQEGEDGPSFPLGEGEGEGYTRCHGDVEV
jgi:hypothetical protein